MEAGVVEAAAELLQLLGLPPAQRSSGSGKPGRGAHGMRGSCSFL